MKRVATHGEKIPAGWKMAWYEPRRRVGVYYPAPLHWVMRLLRAFVYRLKFGWSAMPQAVADVFEIQRAHREREKLATEYARGYMVGWRECFAASVELIEEEITRVDHIFPTH
jgi:hypothetical protein